MVNILFLTSFSLVADLRRPSQRLVHVLSATREKRVYLFMSSTFTNSNLHSEAPAERVPMELVLFTARLNV